MRLAGALLAASTASASSVHPPASPPLALHHAASGHLRRAGTAGGAAGGALGALGLSSPLLRGWLDHVRNLPVHLLQDVQSEPPDKDGSYGFVTKWFPQQVDHINRQHAGKFWQRYFVYDKFSRQEENYPLFVFCGGEQGDIYREWERYGFMVELAREQGAKVLYLEHRFFGASLPFGDKSFERRSDRVGLLSLEQSLADYAAIIREHRGEGPVVTFGGSLSGTIAAMMRIQFPTLVDMAFASSAPVLGVVGVADPFAWRKRITDTFADLGGKDCPGLVRRAFLAFADAAGVRRDRLREAYQPCEDHVEDFQWNALFGMAWQELERLGSFSYPASRSGIPLACQEMREVAKAGGSNEQLFARMLGLEPGGRHGRRCLSMNKIAPLQSEEGAAADTSWATGWSYMACTEVVHPIGANNQTDMFPPYNWTVEGLAASCEYLWAVSPDAGYLQRKVDIRVQRPGAHPRPAPSTAVPGRILFTYGDRDPWSTMVPSTGWADDVEVIHVPGGAHCSDLETSRPEDTEPMRAARRNISAVLTRWINEVRPVRRLRLRRFGSGQAVPASERALPTVQRFLRPPTPLVPPTPASGGAGTAEEAWFEPPTSVGAAVAEGSASPTF